MRMIITSQEIVDAPVFTTPRIQEWLDRKQQAFANRTGVFNTKAGELRTWWDPCGDFLVHDVVFHSSAWTGRA